MVGETVNIFLLTHKLSVRYGLLLALRQNRLSLRITSARVANISALYMCHTCSLQVALRHDRPICISVSMQSLRCATRGGCGFPAEQCIRPPSKICCSEIILGLNLNGKLSTSSLADTPMTQAFEFIRSHLVRRI